MGKNKRGKKKKAKILQLSQANSMNWGQKRINTAVLKSSNMPFGNGSNPKILIGGSYTLKGKKQNQTPKQTNKNPNH